MLVIVKLEKEDIVTSMIGENVAVTAGDKFKVILSKEAAMELMMDIGILLHAEGVADG